MRLPQFPKRDSAFSRRDASEFLQRTIRPENERAQGMPGARCTRSLVCKKQTHERSHHGHTGNHPAFPAQWFYGLLRALPGDQACLTPSPALLIADLTPALGRQNDTTWPYAAARFVKRTDRVHRIPPHARDVRTPLCRDGTVIDIEVIWVRCEAKYFCKRGWARILNIRSDLPV